MTGEIDWIADGGYGSLTGSDRVSYHFYVADVTSEIRIAPGDHVEFRPFSNSQGNVALNVIVTSRATIVIHGPGGKMLLGERDGSHLIHGSMGKMYLSEPE